MSRVYLSSTFADLRPFRDAVYRTLRRMGHDVVAMEDMPASERRPLAECLADVESCELYIGILAWRRGFVPAEGNGIPITQLEYEHAERRMPRLMFLLSPSVPWPPEHFDPPDEGPASIEAFRKHVEDAHVTSYFENPDQLATAVAVAVRKWEIDTGYRPRPAPFVLPEELRVLEYIPYERVKLRYRVERSAFVLQTIFMVIWFGALVTILVLLLADRRPSGCAMPGVLVFLVWGLVMFMRRRTITFDLKNGWVGMQGPGWYGKMRPMSRGFELTTEKTARCWEAALAYQQCEIARTAPMPDPESARARLYSFAVALNQQLGMTILEEKRVGG